MIVNVKEVLVPAVGLDGETATAKKHLVVEEQVDGCPAAGAASIATPSMLAAMTKKETRATIKPAFDMATPSPVSTKGSAPAGPALSENPLRIRTYPQGMYGRSCWTSFLVARLPTTLGADGDGRKVRTAPSEMLRLTNFAA